MTRGALPYVSALRAGTSCVKWGTPNYFNRATPIDVRACLAQGANADAPRRDGGLPIHKAAEHTQHPEVISALIDAGADPMARTTKYRSTPLHFASGYGKKRKRLDLVSVLPASGVDPNTQDIHGETPLHRALGRAYGF